MSYYSKYMKYKNTNLKNHKQVDEKYKDIIYIAYTSDNKGLFNNNYDEFYKEDKTDKTDKTKTIRNDDCNYVVKYKDETKRDETGKFIDIEETIKGNVIYENEDKGFVLIEKTHPQ